MSDLELCYLPATEAIARFKAKTLSPVELLDALIQPGRRGGARHQRVHLSSL